MDGRLGTAPDRSNLVLLAAQLIVEEALEAEVRDEVGRERYERADGEASGYRNGYRTGRMKTAEGVVEFAAPQVRDTAEPFVSGIRQNLAGRTGALEDLAVELYARGLSTRDIEDAFTDEAGRRLLSRAAVSEITERLWAEYEAFTTRDLSEYRIVYLFVDGIAERLRAGQAREPVLAAWGIGEEGGKVLLHLMAGSKEDTETVRAFFQDMRGRGLGDPLLVVSDAYSSDWKVLVDGKPATLYRANYALRGVWVPAGQHTIAFVYRPLSFIVGSSVTLITLVGLIAYGIWERRRLRANRAATPQSVITPRGGQDIGARP
jgi:transposase-like protein